MRRASPFLSQEEEDGSDDDSMSSVTVDELLVPMTRPTLSEEDSDRDSDPAFVSPIDEVKAMRQPPALTTANLHAASRSVHCVSAVCPLSVLCPLSVHCVSAVCPVCVQFVFLSIPSVLGLNQVSAAAVSARDESREEDEA